MKKTPSQPRGFSLVELLTVVALMSTMMVVARPALSFLATGGKFKNSVSQITQTMELARQHAIAKNTYTWVVLATETTVAGPSLRLGFIESKTGVDPTGWTGSFALPTAEMDFAAPLTLHEGVILENISGLIPASPPIPSAGPDALASDAPNFSVTKAGKTIGFQRFVQFTPAGEARVASGMSDYIGLKLVSSTRPADNAYVVLNGLTGVASVHWPTSAQ